VRPIIYIHLQASVISWIESTDTPNCYVGSPHFKTVSFAGGLDRKDRSARTKYTVVNRECYRLVQLSKSKFLIDNTEINSMIDII
jgi:hypothetical protein